jgi:hypothetical protein
MEMESLQFNEVKLKAALRALREVTNALDTLAL